MGQEALGVVGVASLPRRRVMGAGGWGLRLLGGVEFDSLARRRVLVAGGWWRGFGLGLMAWGAGAA